MVPYANDVIKCKCIRGGEARRLQRRIIIYIMIMSAITSRTSHIAHEKSSLSSPACVGNDDAQHRVAWQSCSTKLLEYEANTPRCRDISIVYYHTHAELPSCCRRPKFASLREIHYTLAHYVLNPRDGRPAAFATTS